jgi:2-dehydropantoate 2-reductase
VTPANSNLPSPTTAIAHTAVVGAGAVGGYFGAMLARAGRRVTLVARPAQATAIARDGLRIEKGGRVEAIPMVAHLRPDAVVLSLQNSVENAAAGPY